MTLVTPPEEVETYAQLWELRPPLDDDAAHALIDAVLAAQRRGEASAAAAAGAPA